MNTAKTSLSIFCLVLSSQVAVAQESPADSHIYEAYYQIDSSVITDPAKIDYPTSMGEYFWAGAVTTVFWVDPTKELVAIMMTQYSPFQISEYADLFHRLVNSAVVQ